MWPIRRRTLVWQLVLTYLLLIMLVGALLSLVSLWTVDTLEDHLQKIDMGMAVGRVRDEFLAGRDVKRTDRFFHGKPGSDAFPVWVRQVTPGFRKLEHDGRTWHVMSNDQDGTRYMLLRDYTAFEQNQVDSHWLTVCSVAGSLVAAFILGGVVTRRFVRPLIRLAAQVGKRPGLPPQTRLAENYPDNEIGQLAAAFDETYNQLEAALQREKLFTADVGHELRTPLMIVSSSCELLLDDASMRPEQRSQVQRIYAATKEIHQQLAAYLMLARGRGESSGFTQTDTAAAVTDQVTRWTPRARQLGLALTAEFSNSDESRARETAVNFPAPLLRIVLSNLIRNALQHASDGTRVLVSATPTSLEVSDDGPGVPVDAQARIFMPFVHGSHTSSENLGLGLSLVQRICQHQGWHVSLSSTLGTGTCFRVDLLGNAASKAGPNATGG
jgi:signal transduction histidine kinase